MAYEVAVVGGGIVGLAATMELLGRFPQLTVVVLEKEPTLAAHQTGHNSGVIHSGVYYRPGSLKATMCVEGARLLRSFCDTHGIPCLMSGKVIVATRAEERPILELLYRRGAANGVPRLALIGPERLRELEPNARGLDALHVPEAGRVDYADVARAFADVILRRGGEIHVGARLLRGVRRNGLWRLETARGEYPARFLLTCGGLHADRLAAMAGEPTPLRIIPFRGEYYELVPDRCGLIRSMVYPVPDPSLPFLGVHFTRSITGGVHAGPNAVLAFAREGYRKRDVNLRDLAGMVASPGFWKMAGRLWRVGCSESYRSWNKRAFTRSLQRLVPAVTAADLVPGGNGVRAQAVQPDGTLVDDFKIMGGCGAIHVLNVPSPAATASIRIGRYLAELAGKQFGLS